MTRSPLALLLLVLLAVTGCSADKVKPTAPSDPSTSFQSLENKEAVVNNLYYAYMERNTAEFGKLLASGFVFHFSPNDVADGIVQQTSWDRTAEMNATTNLLAESTGPAKVSAASIGSEESTWGSVKELFSGEPGPVAQNIALEIVEGEWEPVSPIAAVESSPEVYEQNIEYFLEVKIDDTTYTQNKVVVAHLTIALFNIDGKDIWQIVEWRDDVGN